MMTRASQLNSRAYAILAKNWQCLVTVTTVEEHLCTVATIPSFLMWPKFDKRLYRDGMGWDGMGWDGMGWLLQKGEWGGVFGV